MSVVNPCEFCKGYNHELMEYTKQLVEEHSYEAIKGIIDTLDKMWVDRDVDTHGVMKDFCGSCGSFVSLFDVDSIEEHRNMWKGYADELSGMNREQQEAYIIEKIITPAAVTYLFIRSTLSL